MSDPLNPSAPMQGTDTGAAPKPTPWGAPGTGPAARWPWLRPMVLLLAPLCLVFALAPTLYSNGSLLFNLMVYAALAQGVNLLYGFTGYLPFGYVGFFGMGAYGASIGMLTLHLWPPLALLAGGIGAVLLALILVPLLRLSGAYFSIASLAAAEALYYVVSNPSLQGVTNGPYGINLENFFDAPASYAAMVVILALAVGLVVYVRRSRFGLSLMAIRDNPVSASMAGIDVVRTRSLAWLLSAFVAGVVGAVYAWHTSVFYPNSVFDLAITVFAIVFALFGGVGTVLGPLLGAIVLYGLYNVIGLSDPQYFQLIYGFLIVLLVLFLPTGLISLVRRRHRDVL